MHLHETLTDQNFKHYFNLLEQPLFINQKLNIDCY
jgi:hypothetical protein